MMRRRMTFWTVLAPLVVAAPMMLRAAAATNASFTADLSQGQVEILLRAEPSLVRMDRDLIVTIHVSAPDGLMVTLPDLRDRFSGFKVAENFAREPVSANGVTAFEQRWRLVPDLLRTYRLAPFAIEVREPRAGGGAPSSFATRAVVFPAEPPPETVTGTPEVAPKPYWIAPTLRMVATWIFMLFAIVALGVALFWGLKQLERHVHERRLSPRERAFAELDRLLRRHLIDKRLYKDFYIELTMVVRRYIERAHAIHAPEQTTQEFLDAAMRHPHFTPETLARLRLFLESADLVKFAGQESTPQMADSAVSGARDYVTTDATVESGKVKIGSVKSDDLKDKCSVFRKHPHRRPTAARRPPNTEH